VVASDEQLMEAVAAGEEGALAELLERYREPLAHFIHRQTGGRDVDDLFQETWLRIVRAADGFDTDKRFSTWMFQIAVNLCRDWYRRRRAADRHEAATGGAELEAPDSALRAAAALDAATLLSRLPPEQREVVILRYYHDLDEAAVAAVVGCPRGTVKSRLHNAIARMAELSRGEEGGR
jgi:RNA polymerase sigma-70 factor (ECF subfamily)